MEKRNVRSFSVCGPLQLPSTCLPTPSMWQSCLGQGPCWPCWQTLGVPADLWTSAPSAPGPLPGTGASEGMTQTGRGKGASPGVPAGIFPRVDCLLRSCRPHFRDISPPSLQLRGLCGHFGRVMSFLPSLGSGRSPGSCPKLGSPGRPFQEGSWPAAGWGAFLERVPAAGVPRAHRVQLSSPPCPERLLPR